MPEPLTALYRENAKSWDKATLQAKVEEQFLKLDSFVYK
jgi:hypothetical protein